MTASAIALIIEALASAVKIGYQVYNDTKSTLNEADAQKIHAALLKAQAATAELRPRVDAALAAASKV